MAICSAWDTFTFAILEDFQVLVFSRLLGMSIPLALPRRGRSLCAVNRRDLFGATWPLRSAASSRAVRSVCNAGILLEIPR
jgi:hypothetical protein